jgi:hypothetical protein
MTSLLEESKTSTRLDRVRTLGWIGVSAGVVGILMGVVMLTWPEQVPDTQFGYPQSPTAFVVTEILFVLRHLGMLAGFVGVVLLVWPTATRATRVGLGITLAGNVLMVLAEASALRLSNATNDSPEAIPTFVLYGFGIVAMAVGLILAGVGIARTRALPGASGRWITIALGGWILVLLPIMATTTLGRYVLIVWLLLWAVQSLALIKATREQQAGTSRRPATN